MSRVTSVKLGGQDYVILRRREYERLTGRSEGDLPPFPPADADGHRPAREFIRVSIARDVIRERRELGLTQEALARLAGIRPETLSRLESGKHSPNVRTVEKLERALARAASKTST